MPAPARAKERRPKTPPNVQPTTEPEVSRWKSESGSELEDWLRAEDEIRSGLEQQREAEYA
jgi:hypothetical protein